MPVRIQRKRTLGWEMPENTVYVGRPTKWGNPIPWREGNWIVWTAVAIDFRADKPGRRAAAVALYRQWMCGTPARGPSFKDKGDDLIVYTDGFEASTATMARLKAAEFSQLYSDEAPTLPASRPDATELRGKNLACWCPLGQPCHADILLELANPAPPSKQEG